MIRPRPASPPCRRAWPTRPRSGPRAQRHPEAPPGRHRHGPPVPPGPAHRRPALAAPARPDRMPRPPGPALHRPRLETDRHAHHLPAALAGGSHLPGGPHPPGRRNPAPVVDGRHRPHHPGLAGPLQLAHSGRPPPATTTSPPPSPGRLVCQDRSHLRRRPGGDPPRPLDAGPAFFAVPAATPDIQTLPQPPPAPLLAALCYSA